MHLSLKEFNVNHQNDDLVLKVSEVAHWNDAWGVSEYLWANMTGSVLYTFITNSCYPGPMCGGLGVSKQDSSFSNKNQVKKHIWIHLCEYSCIHTFCSLLFQFQMTQTYPNDSLA